MTFNHIRGCMPLLPDGRPLDLGIQRKTYGPIERRELTDQEVVDAIGQEESAILNFTGMMMEGLAIQELSEWIQRCKQRKKTKECRKYTRAMEQAMGGYLESVERIGVKTFPSTPITSTLRWMNLRASSKSICIWVWITRSAADSRTS